MAGATSNSFLLGVFALLIGFAFIAAAIRRRRGRARYAETYAATGGIVYTIASAGCGVVLLLGGLSLMILAMVFKR